MIRKSDKYAFSGKDMHWAANLHTISHKGRVSMSFDEDKIPKTHISGGLLSTTNQGTDRLETFFLKSTAFT